MKLIKQIARYTVALAPLLLSLSSVQAATDNKVYEYKLTNGMTILVKEDHRSPVVVSQIWYKVGGSYEPNGITGISHALEHMMFEGTKLHPGAEFSRIIYANGGEQNASTSADYTNYYQQLSADRLAISFELEADRMQNLQLTAKAFATEMHVVKEERRLRVDNNPQGLAYEYFKAAAHIANPYHQPVIGWMHDLQKFTTADIEQWYKQWYAPNNATLVVVGDVNPQQVFNLAQRYFGAIPPRPVPQVRTSSEIQPLGERNLVVRTPAKLPWLLMGYNVPSLKTATAPWEAYALEVLSYVLDGGSSARFSKELIRTTQVASDINVNYSLYDRLPSLFVITATPSQGQTIAQLKAAILGQIQRVQTTLVTPQELERVKAQVIANKVFQQDSLVATATELGTLASIGLPWQLADSYTNEVTKITPAQIQTVARKYLISDNLTTAELIPLPLNGKQITTQPFTGGANVH